MSYGYRLNVEQLMLKNANEKWQKAFDQFVSVRDSVPETGVDFYINAPDTHDDSTISLCIEAVLGWAISAEGFINLAWQTCPHTKQIDERDYKSTISKIKHLCKVNDINYGSLSWRDSLSQLFELRNSLVHFKVPITYVGFSFAPKYQQDFSDINMLRYQKSVISLINDLGKKLNMDVSFTSGNYELFYYDE
ncbi:hypothetical protein [Photobacterium damselae]|uniref:hypothetical protein n=1 Tax=Photobacterium damselae TaxID=38293 RepID=UPI001EFD9144|nr:hypothetical protein [Photobacterium damselae]MCG9777200.1 hypothetical protein [Photobacterium damselae]